MESTDRWSNGLGCLTTKCHYEYQELKGGGGLATVFTHTHIHTRTHGFPTSQYSRLQSLNWMYGKEERKGNVLFNDALNTFYLRLYGVRHMVKDHSDSERGNPLPPHRLLFSIDSKGYFICTIPRQDNTYHGLCYTCRAALAGTRNSMVKWTGVKPVLVITHELKMTSGSHATIHRHTAMGHQLDTNRGTVWRITIFLHVVLFCFFLDFTYIHVYRNSTQNNNNNYYYYYCCCCCC